MSNDQPDTTAAEGLNQAIMAMAQQTAVHQQDAKVVELVLKHRLDSASLAVATASLQFNSQVGYEVTEKLRRAMKIMLDAQMLRENVAAAQVTAQLMSQQIAAQRDLALASSQQVAAAQQTADLIAQQIAAQDKLAIASNRQAKAANVLSVVNVILAFFAAVLAGVQVWIAITPSHP